MKPCLLLTITILFFFAAQSTPRDTSIEKKKYFTKRLHTSITPDGLLNEEAIYKKLTSIKWLMNARTNGSTKP